MPIRDHDLFLRPEPNALLWRYTDLAKFVSLITTGRLWFSNLEILAKEDPYEGSLSSVRFPHRVVNSIDNMPEEYWAQLVFDLALDTQREGTPEEAFQHWYKSQEVICIRNEAERRRYFINCWHEANDESIAMWKIYGSPGAGVAVVSSCARLEAALAENTENLFLGRAQYRDISAIEVGGLNYLEHTLSKLKNYDYEKEVRLVYWGTETPHNPLVNNNWNAETRRFENIVDDQRPIPPGLSFLCDLDQMIERVIVSPFAPPWYVNVIEALRDRFGFKFPVFKSILLDPPQEYSHSPGEIKVIPKS